MRSISVGEKSITIKLMKFQENFEIGRIIEWLFPIAVEINLKLKNNFL